MLDIQTKTDAFNNSGSVSVCGGSHGNFTTSVDYGGTIGQTCSYVSGRYFGSDVGIENPTPAYNAINDRTDQEKGFAYVSTAIDPTSRLTYIGGVSNGAYQIPNNPGQPQAFTAYGVSNFDSALLNERQKEFNQFNVVPTRNRPTGSTTRSRISTATASSTSRPIRSAIWSQRGRVRRVPPELHPTEFRRTPPTSSASRTP